MWIPVRIAVQPISQTRCQPDANTERKRGNRYMLGRVTPHSPPSGSPPIMRDIKRESSPRNKKTRKKKLYETEITNHYQRVRRVSSGVLGAGPENTQSPNG